MTKTEAARLAAAVSILRPDWPTASLQTFIDTHLAHRPLRDAAVALTWTATDPDTKTPARVLEAGPWWTAARTHDVPTNVNTCQLHPLAQIRIDHHGEQTCAGCYADINAANEPLPLDRHGVPPTPEVRREIVAAIHSAHPSPTPLTRPKPDNAVMATARAELEAARAAHATPGEATGGSR